MSARDMFVRLVRRVWLRLVDRLSTPALFKLVKWSITRRVSRLQAADSLRFLFEFENMIYLLQGQQAIEYGEGTHTKHRHTRYHDFFVDRIASGERVIDIGCGIGALAFAIADRSGARVTGIDISQANIERARKDYSHPAIDYLPGDVLASPLQGDFDVVVLSNVLEHLPGRPAFLQAIEKSLHPARYLIRVPLFERDWRVPLKRELGVEWRLDDTHETEYTVESFASEIEEAGLVITHQEIHWGEIWAEVQSAR